MLAAVLPLIAVGFFYREKLFERALHALALLLRLPTILRRRAYHRATYGAKNQILGAIAIAENAKHPLDGINITAQCLAFYASYQFPCADDLSKWLAPPPRGLTIIHVRNGNILLSVIDLTDKHALIFEDGEYVFEQLAFNSVEVDDLAGISVYNCAQLSGAVLDNTKKIADGNDAENGVD